MIGCCQIKQCFSPVLFSCSSAYRSAVVLQGGACAPAVPALVQQVQDLQLQAQQAQQALHEQMRSMQQEVAPGLWTGMEQLHETAFGVKHVAAAELQPVGQAAAIERMQVGFPHRRCRLQRCMPAHQMLEFLYVRLQPASSRACLWHAHVALWLGWSACSSLFE